MKPLSCRSNYLITTFTLLLSGAIAQTAWTDSTLANGNTVHMKIDPRTGVPHRLTGLDVDFKRYGDLSEANIQAMSRTFLVEYADLFRIETESLVLKKAENRKGRWHVSYKQQINGVPVYGTSVGFTVFSNGNIPLVGIDYYPDIDIDVTPGISAEMALEVALTDFIQLSDADTVDTRRSPVLIILPREEHESYTYSLAYQLELVYKGPQSIFDECYFIHAGSGDIIQRYSNIREASIYGTVSIRFWPEHHYDTQSTGKARHERVRLYNYIGQYLDTDYTSTTGYYNFPYLAVSYYYVRSMLEGSYVRLYQNSENHDAFVYVGAHNWTWNASDATNVYYHADKIHDFFKGSPFSYSGMDYQVKAYVNDGPDENGWSNGINIGFGSEDIDQDQTAEQWARSSDVVFHEYSHCTIYHLYDNEWIGYVYDEEGWAMDEGLVDYFAISLNGRSNNNDPILGESVKLSKNYSVNHTMAQFNAIPGYPWYMPQGAHLNGLIIGGACWDLRQDPAISVSYADELVFDALEMTPHAYDFEDFALNVLVADDNDGNLNNGTPHYDEIEEAFEINHGIPVYDPPPDPPPAAPTGLTITNAGQFGQYVQLAWNANSEPDLNHYNVWRECTYPSDPDCDLQVIASRTSTSYTDTRVTIQGHYPEMEIFYYYVTAVDDASQESEKSSPASTWGKWWFLKGMDQVAEEFLPEAYALGANHPNPFNPVTTIRYDLPEASRVSLVLYDMTGREVRRWQQQEPPGYRQLVWDGTDHSGRLAPTGIYIYRLVAASVESDQRFTASRKMVLLK